MKKSHLFIIVVIAMAIAIIATTAGDASTYVNFDTAEQLAKSGSKKDIHVVGELKKDAHGNVVGIREGADRVSFSFIMVDDKGREQNVFYNEPMPTDLIKSEKVVVIGSYEGDDFNASKILLKCPSKYQEENVKI
jgi:cytochrome c-type biogenesis protein CcmE